MREGGSGSAPGAAVVATVKWFNPVKGFGFLTPADGSPDIFCHVSSVSRAGFDTLPEGATVTCEIEQGRQGMQVWQIHAVDTSTAAAGPTRSGRPPRGDYGHLHGERGPASGRRVVAMVKWFNPAKGFGFLVPDDGSPDVFCHASAVQDAGFDTLLEGATVTCEVAEGGRGPAVSSIVGVDASTAMAEPAGRFEPDRDRPGRRWDRDVPAGHRNSIPFSTHFTAPCASQPPQASSASSPPSTAIPCSSAGCAFIACLVTLVDFLVHNAEILAIDGNS